MGMSRMARAMIMNRGNGGMHKDKGAYAHDERENHMVDYDEQEDKEEGYSPHHEFDKETATRWVSSMKSDYIAGGKWSYEQTSQLMRQKGYTFDPSEFYAVINMLCSDYGETLAKYGVTSADAYAELACDWLEDEDIAHKKDKTARYYDYIVI